MKRRLINQDDIRIFYREPHASPVGNWKSKTKSQMKFTPNILGK
jgi:hypothetical protein